MSAGSGLELKRAIERQDPTLFADIVEDSWPESDDDDFEGSLAKRLGRLIEAGRVDLLKRALAAAPWLGLATWENALGSGQTLLMAACSHGNEEAVRALLPLSNAWACKEHGGDALYEACSGRAVPEIVKILLAELGADKSLCLSAAGASMFAEQTALMAVADSYGADEDVAAVVHMLLPWHDVNAKSSENTCDLGMAALAYAARSGHVLAVQALLAHGADPLMVNNDGDTALMYAARMGHPAIVEILLPISDPLAVGVGGFGALAMADKSCKAMIAAWIERKELTRCVPSVIREPGRRRL